MKGPSRAGRLPDGIDWPGYTCEPFYIRIGLSMLFIVSEDEAGFDGKDETDAWVEESIAVSKIGALAS